MANPYMVQMGRPLTGAVQNFMMGQQFAQQRAAQQQQQQMQAQTRQLAPAALMGDPQAMAQLASVNLQAAAQVQQSLAQQQRAQQEQAQFRQTQATEMMTLAKEGFGDLAKIESPQDKQKFLQQLENQMKRQFGEQSYNELGPLVLRNILEQQPELRGDLIAMQEAVAAEAPPALTPYQAEQVRLEEAKLDMRELENEQRRLDRELTQETNALKRRELEQKIATNDQKLDQAKRQQEASGEAAIATVDRTLRTIDRIMDSPGFSAAVGAKGVTSFLPGTDAQETKALIETLQSQAFLTEIEKMTGMGALSDAEGRKLATAVGALNLDMSEEAFRRNLNEIKSDFEAAKKRTEKKYQVESADLPEQPPGTQQGPGTLQMQEGRTATNPQTGQKMVFRGGQWMPIGY